MSRDVEIRKSQESGSSTAIAGEWQTCPKCGGQGHVNKPPYVAGDQPSWCDNVTGGYQCPVCLGAKVIVRPTPTKVIYPGSSVIAPGLSMQVWP